MKKEHCKDSRKEAGTDTQKSGEKDKKISKALKTILNGLKT